MNTAPSTEATASWYLGRTTQWGQPIVYKNESTGKFDVIPYGDMTRPLAMDFQDIDAVGAWVRIKGGCLGGFGRNVFVGRYREVYLPNYRYGGE